MGLIHMRVGIRCVAFFYGGDCVPVWRPEIGSRRPSIRSGNKARQGNEGSNPFPSKLVYYLEKERHDGIGI